MSELAFVGASFRTAGFERLGELVLPPDERAAGLPALARALGTDELVDVATCNRVEAYVAPARGRDVAGLPAAFAGFFAARGAQVGPELLEAGAGRAAYDRLLRVAAALDSLVLGETEIAGQVRRAADEAQGLGLLGERLRPAFERASACSRRVRAALDAARPPASAADLAVAKIEQHFGADGPRVSVLVGVGPMTRKVAAALARAPGERLFVNRTVARAEELARRFGGRALSLEDLERSPPAWIDLVFTATSARSFVLRPEHLAPALEARRAAEAAAPLIVCDLGVPRDVDPACDALPGVLVVALEHMEVLAQMRAGQGDGLVQAASIVAEEVDRLAREERFREIASESARAMLSGRLAHLPAADREAILRFAGGLAARFARQPGAE